MKDKVLRAFCYLSFIIFILLFNFSTGFSGITVKPGIFDHLQIDIPTNLIAGKEVKIVIYAFDAFGNPVSMPTESIKEYKLVTTGSAKIEPSYFKSSDVKQSGFSATFIDEKAEEVIVSLYEANSPFPIFEKRVKILPDNINSLSIKTQPHVRVGSEFEILITGKDKYNNTVCKDFNTKELNLFFKGDVSPQIRDIRYLSEQCDIVVKLYSEKTGSFYLEASLLNKNISGKSEKIDILNADVSSFIVEAPQEAVAGEPFDVTILAIDRFNNYVKDFASQKEKIIIEAKGKGYIFPTELSSHAFIDGRAKISVRYDKPEEIKVTVRDYKNINLKGESNIVKIVPPKVKRFEIISPDTVIAGQKFKIKIIAYNQFDKVMSHYNLYGKTVLLKTTGRGTLTPNKVPPSEFINGVANVEVMYNKAEQFDIIASVEEEVPVKETPTTKVHIKKKKVEKIEKPAPKIKKKEVSKKTEKPVSTKKHIEVLKGPVLEVKNLSFVETKNVSTLTLFVPEIDKHGGYRPITQKTNSKMSVSIEIYPAENKIETPLKVDSDLVKNVSVSQDKNRVILNIELKKPIKYKTIKKKDEIVIELRRN